MEPSNDSALVQQCLAILEARQAAQRARVRRRLGWIALALVVIIPWGTFALPSRNVFESGTPISAGDVNTNFENLWNQVEANASSVQEVESRHEVVFSEEETVTGLVSETEFTAVYGSVNPLSVTITTTGRPVFVGLAAADPDTRSMIQVHDASQWAARADFRAVRVMEGSAAETVAFTYGLRLHSGKGGTDSSADSVYGHLPPSAVWHIDAPLSAGTYTYTLEAKLMNGDGIQFYNVRMIAYEL